MGQNELDNKKDKNNEKKKLLKSKTVYGLTAQKIQPTLSHLPVIRPLLRKYLLKATRTRKANNV